MRNFVVLLMFSLIGLSNVFSQDFIYKNDGTELKVIVNEITLDAIKYKNFNQPDGPIRNILKTEVFMIIYKDGTKEVFKDQTEDKRSNSNSLSKSENTTISEKNDVCIDVIEKRPDPTLWGYMYSGALYYVPKKRHDKKNEIFPTIKTLFNNKFKEEGFALTSENKNSTYKMDIGINKIEFNSYDKFTHIKLVYICSVSLSLTNLTNNQIVYNKEFSSTHECKRSKCDKLGFENEVNDIFMQLIEDTELQKFIKLK